MIELLTTELPVTAREVGAMTQVHLVLEDVDYSPAIPASNHEQRWEVEHVVDQRRGEVRLTETYPAVAEVVSFDPARLAAMFDDDRPVSVYPQRDGRWIHVWITFRAITTASLHVYYADAKLADVGPIVVKPAPVVTRRPGFGVYDEWDDVEALAPDGLQRATTGVDRHMQRVSGRTKPSVVNGAWRSYITIRGARWTEESAQARTARSFPTPTTVNCLWFHNDPALRYSEAGVRELADGKHDDDIRIWVQSLPLDVRAYGFPLHEADLKGVGGAEAGDLTPDTYHAGIQHFLEVASDEALSMGRTPQNFGIGGLLTEGPLARGVGDPWIWSRGLPRWLYDTGFLVGAWDPYFLMRDDGTREPFRAKVDAQAATYEKTGVTRLFIAETAQGLDLRSKRDTIVGTATDQVHHLEQLEKWLVEKGEFGFLFSKELGWMSRNGSISRPGREAAARKAYYIGEKLNIPVVAQ